MLALLICADSSLGKAGHCLFANSRVIGRKSDVVIGGKVASRIRIEEAGKPENRETARLRRHLQEIMLDIFYKSHETAFLKHTLMCPPLL